MKAFIATTAIVLGLATAASANSVDQAQRILNSYGFDAVSAASLTTHQRVELAFVDTSEEASKLQIRAEIASILRD